MGLAGFTNVSTPAPVTAAVEAAFKALSDAGATVVDLDGAGFTFTPASGEFGILLYDFKNDVQAYFATRVGVPVAGKTLADAIAFNSAHAEKEMPYFNQDIFDLAQSLNTTDPNAPQDPSLFGGNSYNAALDLDQAAGVSMDTALKQFNLDAVVTATAVWIVGLPATAGPTADGFEGAEVRPLRKTRLTQNHRPARAQVGSDSRVARRRGSKEREGPGGGLHSIAGTGFRATAPARALAYATGPRCAPSPARRGSARSPR